MSIVQRHFTWVIFLMILLVEEKSMKSYRKELSFNIPSRRGFINITAEVETALREIGIRGGFVLINHNHITASRNHRL